MGLPLEELWAEMLSREPVRIIEAWNTLTLDEQSAVWVHLQRMATEEGWTEPQCISADVALNVLREHGVTC